MNGAFTIDFSAPTLRINLNEHPIFIKHINAIFLINAKDGEMQFSLDLVVKSSK
jgi:hypothetical protein